MGRRAADQAKKAALASLGRHLSRRARSRCELCESSESLAPTLLQAAEDPDLDNVLLLCERCACVLRGGRIEDPDGLRFLESAVWSEEPNLQAVAVRMLERLETPWALATRENLWISDEIRTRVDGLDPA